MSLCWGPGTGKVREWLQVTIVCKQNPASWGTSTEEYEVGFRHKFPMHHRAYIITHIYMHLGADTLKSHFFSSTHCLWWIVLSTWQSKITRETGLWACHYLDYINCGEKTCPLHWHHSLAGVLDYINGKGNFSASWLWTSSFKLLLLWLLHHDGLYCELE